MSYQKKRSPPKKPAMAFQELLWQKTPSSRFEPHLNKEADRISVHMPCKSKSSQVRARVDGRWAKRKVVVPTSCQTQSHFSVPQRNRGREPSCGANVCPSRCPRGSTPLRRANKYHFYSHLEEDTSMGRYSGCAVSSSKRRQRTWSRKQMKGCRLLAWCPGLRRG